MNRNILRAVSLLIAGAFAAVSAHAQSSGATLDSLASDLAALTARVAKLEGQITAADLAGTYAVTGIQMELGPGAPYVSSYVYVGTAALGADGTASLTLTVSGNELTLGSKPSLSPFMASGGGTRTITSTWTYSNGVVTTLDGVSLTVALGGRLLIAASANNSDGTNVLLIFSRLQ